VNKNNSVLAAWAIGGFISLFYLGGFAILAINKAKEGDIGFLILAVTTAMLPVIAFIKLKFRANATEERLEILYGKPKDKGDE
jgi:hypothetical membrane protein